MISGRVPARAAEPAAAGRAGRGAAGDPRLAALQRRADASPGVLRLGALQRLALQRQAPVMQRVDSVTRESVMGAMHSLHPGWTLGTDERTIAVWQIDSVQKWDFHFSAIFDKTGQNMTRFHYTIRYGDAKGDDAFAWFDVVGHNAAATAGARADAGKLGMYQPGDAEYRRVPRRIRGQFANIPGWATALVQTAASYH
jgi:hypothetical protein